MLINGSSFQFAEHFLLGNLGQGYSTVLSWLGNRRINFPITALHTRSSLTCSYVPLH